MKTQVNGKFLSKEHEQRFMRLVATREVFANDINYTSAGYLLSADKEIYCKAMPYITSQGINFTNMMHKVDFTTGQYIIVQIAYDLFASGSNQKLSITDLIYSDSDMVLAVCTAIQLYTDIDSKIAGEKMLASMFIK